MDEADRSLTREDMDRVTGGGTDVDYSSLPFTAVYGGGLLGTAAAAVRAAFARKGRRYAAAGRTFSRWAPVGAVVGAGLDYLSQRISSTGE